MGRKNKSLKELQQELDQLSKDDTKKVIGGKKDKGTTWNGGCSDIVPL